CFENLISDQFWMDPDDLRGFSDRVMSGIGTIARMQVASGRPPQLATAIIPPAEDDDVLRAFQYAHKRIGDEFNRLYTHNCGRATLAPRYRGQGEVFERTLHAIAHAVHADLESEGLLFGTKTA